MQISQVLEEQSVVDSLVVVNFNLSLIKLGLDQYFNFKFYSLDLHFSESFVSRFVRATSL